MTLLRIADTETPPSHATIERAKQRQGIAGWIGYLRSPYAADSWAPADLGRVLVVAGRMLPVYVGPYDAKTLAAMNPTRDAAQAVDDLSYLRGSDSTHGVPAVCLDIEPGAWAASPADVLDYFRTFRAELHAHGYDTTPYASPGTLLGLGQRVNIGWVWCASWRAKYGRAPKPLWPTDITPPGLGTAWQGRRAWQQAGGPRVFGTRADLSLFPADFPLVVHAAQPAPTPTPSKPNDATGGVPPTPPPVAPPTVEVSVVTGGHTFAGRIPRTG